MSEQTSARWLTPPRSNSSFRHCMNSSSIHGHRASLPIRSKSKLSFSSAPGTASLGSGAHRVRKKVLRGPPTRLRAGGRSGSEWPVAGIVREFIGLASPAAGRAGAGGHPCQGLYHRPAAARPSTAFIATHYNVDFSEHYLASFMSERGFGFLGWNTRFRGNEAHFLLDHALAEIGVGVRWLREQAGVERVVLLGIENLPAGDLYVALAAHSGRPEVLTAWLDASVTDESDPLSVDPALDPYDPANGLPYSADFQLRYRAAQRDRNERITSWALDQLGRLAGTRARDRLFTVPRSWADLRMVDPSIEPSDRRPNWCYLGDPMRANYGVFGVGTVSTLRSWLSMWSLRTSQCTAAPHLARITLPALVIHATADTGVYSSDARTLYDALAAPDKTLEFIKADHYLQEPDGARTQAADLIAAWVTTRA